VDAIGDRLGQWRRAGLAEVAAPGRGAMEVGSAGRHQTEASCDAGVAGVLIRCVLGAVDLDSPEPEMAQMGHVRLKAAQPEVEGARVCQRRDSAGRAHGCDRRSRHQQLVWDECGRVVAQQARERVGAVVSMTGRHERVGEVGPSDRPPCRRLYCRDVDGRAELGEP